MACLGRIQHSQRLPRLQAHEPHVVFTVSNQLCRQILVPSRRFTFHQESSICSNVDGEYQWWKWQLQNDNCKQWVATTTWNQEQISCQALHERTHGHRKPQSCWEPEQRESCASPTPTHHHLGLRRAFDTIIHLGSFAVFQDDSIAYKQHACTEVELTHVCFYCAELAHPKPYHSISFRNPLPRGLSLVHGTVPFELSGQ